MRFFMMPLPESPKPIPKSEWTNARRIAEKLRPKGYDRNIDISIKECEDIYGFTTVYTKNYYIREICVAKNIDGEIVGKFKATYIK